MQSDGARTVFPIRLGPIAGNEEQVPRLIIEEYTRIELVVRLERPKLHLEHERLIHRDTIGNRTVFEQGTNRAQTDDIVARRQSALRPQTFAGLSRLGTDILVDDFVDASHLRD